MSDKAWDDDDYEVYSAPKPVDDRWEGEDVDNVKDNWDDDDDETPVATTTTQPKKKSMKQRIMEKQEQKEAEMKAKREELQKIAAELTPEEKYAEKLRLQKIQEESDLQFAVDMMGITNADITPEVDNIKDADISSEAGLNALGTAIIRKIRDTEGLEKKLSYATFLETFCKDLCANLKADELKKVSASLNTLYNEKVKSNKPTKGKKKGSGKATINVGKAATTRTDDRFIDDLDDFL